MDAIQQLQNAIAAMFSNSDYQSYQAANEYLQQFRLSEAAWSICHEILSDETDRYDLQCKLFASQTLRAKINFNLAQVPGKNIDDLRQSLVKLVMLYTNAGVKLIVTHLNLALVSLALQSLEWKDPISDIIVIFEGQAKQEKADKYIVTLLQFLKFVPEECSDMIKIPLTDKQFAERTDVLVTSNKNKVLALLTELASSATKSVSASVLSCLNSWVPEFLITKILANATLYQLIFSNLINEENFELSIEVLISIIQETRDLENLDIISDLYSELIKLKPLLFNHFDNLEIVNGLTRLFVEIGESWNSSIIKNPEFFKELVEILLKCCEFKEDLSVIKYTFNFWYMSAELLTSRSYGEQKTLFVPVFHRLIQIITEQLKYPVSDESEINFNQTTKELFDGDAEAEEKFKDFRYDMGDVLKECCAIVGPEEALTIPFNQIQSLMNSAGTVHWQHIEAPLFCMRSMAFQVQNQGNSPVLNNVFELLLQLINNDSQLLKYGKVRYATILLFGRYTQYTYFHNSYMKPQLDFIIQNLSQSISSSNLTESQKDIVTASSNSLMYFCQDCSKILIPYLPEFYEFYNSIRNNTSLDLTSLYEITDGFGYIINSQKTEDEKYNYAKLFIEPTLKELNTFNENAAQITASKDDNLYKVIADKIELVSVLISVMTPWDYDLKESKVANLIIEIYPVFEALFSNFKLNFKVSERLVKFIRVLIENFTTFLLPILTNIINLVNDGYKNTKFGCYLWITGIIIRIFNDDEFVTNETKQVVYEFAKLQGELFISSINEVLSGVDIGKLLTNQSDKQAAEFERAKVINQLIPVEDKVEDFFRMLDEIITYFPFEFIGELQNSSSLAQHGFQIAILALNLNKFDPLLNTIRYLIDFISWGNVKPPVALHRENPLEVREKIASFLVSGNDANSNGLLLFNICFKGLVFQFPVDAQYEAYDLMIKLAELVFLIDANNAGNLLKLWVEFAINDLPLETVSDQEKFKVLREVELALSKKSFRKFRMSIKGFISYYNRKTTKDGR